MGLVGEIIGVIVVFFHPMDFSLQNKGMMNASGAQTQNFQESHFCHDDHFPYLNQQTLDDSDLFVNSFDSSDEYEFQTCE